jgi:radical SAM protein with 4Fe4S-binding SPASM domain
MNKALIKPVNALVAGYGFLKNSVIRNGSISGMPVTVSVEPTSHCNLKCPECYSGSGLMTRKRGFMEVSLFDRIITELGPYLFEMSLYFQGEPMLHSHFFSFLAKSSEINTTVATNGHFLSEENAEKLALSGLNNLIVSLDGMDQSSYSAYRINGEAELVIQGIRNMSEALKRTRSSMKLVIQFLVNKQNEHQIHRIKHFAKEINASLRLKSMQIINNENYEKWLPLQNKFRRYELTGEKYVLKNKLPDRCARMWFNPVITWDGKVLPCCFDKNADHIMGDLYEDSFSEIWNGPKYKIFRKRIFTARSQTEICRNCTSGLSRKIRH